jgi:hypothetical protein
MVFFAALSLVVLLSVVILVSQYRSGVLAEPRRNDTRPPHRIGRHEHRRRAA